MTIHAIKAFMENCEKAGFKVTYAEDRCKELHNCLTCGDIRYTDYFEAIVLDVFLACNAIIRESFSISMPFHTMNHPKNFYGNGDVQAFEKAILTKVLKSKGFTIDGYELWCSAGKADLLAHKNDVKVVGECGACRVTKVLETLLTPPFVKVYENLELWHMPYPKTIDRSGRKTIESIIYIYRRGKNWRKIYRQYYNCVYGEIGKFLTDRIS